jgi:hypothetical protein
VFSEEIEVVIDKSGKVQISVKGTKGPDCASRTESLIQILGGQVEEHVQTEEFFASGVSDQQNQQLGR